MQNPQKNRIPHREKMLIRLFIIFLVTINWHQTDAQLMPEYKKSSPTHTVFSYSADYGSTIVHTPVVKPIGGAHPFGFGVEYGKQAFDSATYHLCSAFPRVGWQVQYVHYGTPVLGNSLMASYFIQPVYRLSPRVNFFYRGALGLSYSDNPFNPKSNIDSFNLNYSVRFNPYVQLAGGFGFHLTPHLSVELRSTFHHLSNGNQKRPNTGLNWITNSASLVYHPEGNGLPKLHRVHDKYWQTRPWNFSFGMLYVAKQGYAGPIGRYQRLYAAGGFVETAKQIGRIHAIVVGVQAYYNCLKVDANKQIDNSSLKRSSLLAGIYMGHSFLMGRFIFNEIAGVYITPHSSIYSKVFHQHNIRYVIDSHWQGGLGLKVHKSDADFVCFNIIYQL